MRTTYMLLFAVFTLAGCGPQSQSASNAGENRIFDTQRSALDKAKAVNDTAMQGDQALRAREEAQGR
jgi:hypothetical protein